MLFVQAVLISTNDVLIYTLVKLNNIVSHAYLELMFGGIIEIVLSA